MPIYDNDGTTSYEVGKVYDNDGTTSYQIGKVYDNDGTTSYLLYTSDPNQHVFQNGAFDSDFENYTVYPGAGIESETWYWNKGSSVAPAAQIADPMVLGYWYAAQGRNGYTFIFNDFVEISDWTKVSVRYKKVSNGYYNSGNAADGSYCYGTIGFLSEPLVMEVGTSLIPPVTLFARTELIKTLNTDSIFSVDIPAGTSGYLFFSVFNTDSAGGTVSIDSIYFE